MNQSIRKMREAERKSHIDTYSSTVLFEQGSWLSKPIKTVVELFPYFETMQEFCGLDLGCGVGRNCIPLAQQFDGKNCAIDCVDILDVAIDYLKKYSEKYGVSDYINGIVMPIEAFEVKKNYYDLVLGISSLEHAESEAVFCDMLMQIAQGVKNSGFVCFVINTDVKEVDKQTQTELLPQFEVNLTEPRLKDYLEKAFAGWEVMKYLVSTQEYDIPRETMVHLTTKAVTYVARKR